MSWRWCVCGERVKGKTRCPKCKPKRRPSRKEKEGLTTAERGYDSKWQRLSVAYRTEHPLCEDCYEQGKLTPATSVHHIEPIENRPDLRLVWSNLMALCETHHRARDATGNTKRSGAWGT